MLNILRVLKNKWMNFQRNINHAQEKNLLSYMLCMLCNPLKSKSSYSCKFTQYTKKILSKPLNPENKAQLTSAPDYLPFRRHSSRPGRYKQNTTKFPSCPGHHPPTLPRINFFPIHLRHHSHKTRTD